VSGIANVSQIAAMTAQSSDQDQLYHQAAETYGAALERLGRAYEANPDARRDLVQEIHIALWRSFEGFDQRCSLRTWIYRVAHNAASSHVIRQRRARSQVLVGLEELENLPEANSGQHVADRSQALNQLLNLIQHLKPLDRQVILSYLEGLDAASIGEITGLSPGNVATKIHRIKSILTRRFHAGGQDEQ
jgi:RNA polymerase sigma-70 factor, ECF subfamily